MKFNKTVIAVILFFFIPLISFGADVAKIGIIDFQKVFDMSEKGKEVDSRLQERGKLLFEELNQKGKEIEKLKEERDRGAMVLSKEAIAEKEREINIKLYDLKLLKEKYTAQLKDEEQAVVNQIKEDILELVKNLGKEEGYLIIFESRGAGVVYAPKTIDITDRVILLYNEQYTKEKDKQ